MISTSSKINEKELKEQKSKTIWVVRYIDEELSYNKLVTDDLFLAICWINVEMWDTSGYRGSKIKEFWRSFKEGIIGLDWRDNPWSEYSMGYFIEEHELNKLPNNK